MGDGGYRVFDKLSQLTPVRAGVYYAQFHCMIVSVKLGIPNRVFVTDFTDNKHMEQSFVNENWITHFTDRIPMEKILLLNTYEEKFAPLLNRYRALRGEQFPVGSLPTNVLDKAIFCKVKAKMKEYNGVLDGNVIQIEMIDIRGNHIDHSLPIFQNIFSYLPTEFIANNQINFRHTYTEQQVGDRIENPNASSEGMKEPPIQQHQKRQQQSQPTQQRQQRNYSQPHPQRAQTTQTRNQGSFLESSPTPAQSRGTTLPDSSFIENTPNRSFKLSSAADLPSDSTHDKDYETSRSPHTQVRATLDEKNVVYIKKLNQIDQVDGKVYEVKGKIVEFEPLLNQLCVKYESGKPPVLHPLSIIITDRESINQALDETQLLKFTFTTKSEIYNFLGMHEIEEVYIKSQQIYRAFDRILKSGNIFRFKVTRRLIKVNDIRGHNNYILGWEAQNLTLNSLLDQI